MNSEGQPAAAVRFSTLLDESHFGAKDVVLRLRPELVSTCLVLVVVSPHLSPLSLSLSRRLPGLPSPIQNEANFEVNGRASGRTALSLLVLLSAGPR